MNVILMSKVTMISGSICSKNIKNSYDRSYLAYTRKAPRYYLYSWIFLTHKIVTVLHAQKLKIRYSNPTHHPGVAEKMRNIVGCCTMCLKNCPSFLFVWPIVNSHDIAMQVQCIPWPQHTHHCLFKYRFISCVLLVKPPWRAISSVTKSIYFIKNPVSNE